MLKRNKNKNKETNNNVTQEPVVIPSDVVRVSTGAGAESKDIPYVEGDSIQSILTKAEVEVPAGKVVTLGSNVVNDLNETKIKGGDILVISKAPSNG